MYSQFINLKEYSTDLVLHPYNIVGLMMDEPGTIFVPCILFPY